MTEKENKLLLKLIGIGLKEFPKVLARKKRAFKEKQKRLKAFGPLSKSLKKQVDSESEAKVKSTHPWRICPAGQFSRRSHKQNAYMKSNGKMVRGSIHPNECVINDTGKDQLYPSEIREIASLHFKNLKNLPVDDILDMYRSEKEYDHLIAGWTQYWNEVLKPEQALDPNFVKALISTESGFNPKADNKLKGSKRARGLMQVKDESVKLLSNRSKELKDHFVNLTESDMLDPNLSICAGVRWLFRKREIVLSRKPKASWTEVLMNYKSYTSLEDKEMQKFIGRYEALNSKDKSKFREKIKK